MILLKMASSNVIYLKKIENKKDDPGAKSR
jgi:hypothetical protein